MIRQAKKVKPV